MEEQQENIRIWDRLTAQSQEVLLLAHEAAAHQGVGYVEPAHLLLALFAQEETAAARALTGLVLSRHRIAAALCQQIPGGEGRILLEMQLTPLSKRILEAAGEQARLGGVPVVATAHLLLGLLEEKESLAARLLNRYEVDHEVAARAIQAVRGHGGPMRPEDPPAPWRLTWTEPACAAVREDVRAAGRGARNLRWGLLIGLALLPLIGILVVWAAATVADLRLYAIIFISTAVVLSVSGTAGVASSALCRWYHRTRLRRRLAALSPTEAMRILDPLRNEHLSDTRRIVAPLLREFGRTATEVTPAVPAAGRGD